MGFSCKFSPKPIHWLMDSHGFPVGQSLSIFFSKRWHQDGQIAFFAQNFSALHPLLPVKTKMEHTKSQPPKIKQKHMFKGNNRHDIIFLAHFQAHFPGSIYFQKIIFQIPICLNSHLPSQVVQVFFWGDHPVPNPFFESSIGSMVDVRPKAFESVSSAAIRCDGRRCYHTFPATWSGLVCQYNIL